MFLRIITTTKQRRRYGDKHDWQVGGCLNSGFEYLVFKPYLIHDEKPPFHVKGRSFRHLKQRRYDKLSRLFGFQVDSG